MTSADTALPRAIIFDVGDGLDCESRSRRRSKSISLPLVHEIATMEGMGGEAFAAIGALRISYTNAPPPLWVWPSEKITFTIARESHKVFYNEPLYLLVVTTEMKDV